jgi:hypothetical protein
MFHDAFLRKKYGREDRYISYGSGMTQLERYETTKRLLQKALRHPILRTASDLLPFATSAEMHFAHPRARKRLPEKFWVWAK